MLREGRSGAGAVGEEASPRVSIMVDARGLHVSGIGRYLREVLAVVLEDDRFRRIHLLGEAGELEAFCGAAMDRERVRITGYDHGFYSPRAQLAWVGLRLRGRVSADVHFFPHYDAPLALLPPSSVVTVQDLIHFKVPDAFPASRRAAAALLLRRVVRQAGRVLVTSRSTRSDLAERLPGCESKIRVIPLGVSPFFSETDASEPPHGVRVPYLLCVGNRKPHKNLAAAVEVLARLAEERPELTLVFAGAIYPGWEEVMGAAESLGVGSRIVDLPPVSDEALRALYRGCEALLFLSRYEGFGLPVLEAMASGAPVIASDRSSIPEVVGEAGILVAPEDTGAAAEAVLRLQRDPDLRETLRERGRLRAAEFTWSRAASATVEELYRVALLRAAVP